MLEPGRIQLLCNLLHSRCVTRCLSVELETAHTGSAQARGGRAVLQARGGRVALQARGGRVVLQAQGGRVALRCGASARPREGQGSLPGDAAAELPRFLTGPARPDRALTPCG